MNLVQRLLFVAWQNPTTRRIYPVGRLIRQDTEPVWEYVYLQGARAAKGFSPFPGLPDFERRYLSKSGNLPPFLQNRLMPKSRPDRAAFIQRLGLDSAVADEIPILARSEGLKETDTIEVFGLPSYDPSSERYRYFFFVRGIRYVDGADERILRLAAGDELALIEEADNVKDPKAILVSATDGDRLGWVPRTLVEDLGQFLAQGAALRVAVQRVNPAPAPVQLRLLCCLELPSAEGFTPFASAHYQPIPEDAVRIAIEPQKLVG